MDIKAFSNVNLLTQQAARPTQKQQTASSSLENSKKTLKEKSIKAAPYIAGAVILAGLGIYAFKSRGKVKSKDIENAVNKGETVVKEIQNNVETIVEKAEKTVSETGEKVVEKAKEIVEKSVAETTPKSGNTINPNITPVVQDAPKTVEKVTATITEKTETVEKAIEKPVSQTVETIKKAAKETAEDAVPKATVETVKDVERTSIKTPENTKSITEEVVQDAPKPPKRKTQKQQLTEFTEKIIADLNFKDPKIIEKIERNRKNEQNEITRIVNENYHNGSMDMHGMAKAAKGYINDIEGRGEDRFHKAADLIEQALIKETIGGSERQRGNLTAYIEVAAKTPLYNIYAAMPFEEAATRIKHLIDNDLYHECYLHGMSMESWFQTSMEILVKKFKKFTPQK